jgi:copper chaperone CopZ
VAVVLLGVLAFSYLYRPQGTAAEQNAQVQTTPAMAVPSAEAGLTGESLELAIKGMTCDHCAASVEQVLTACPGVSSVQVHRSAGRVSLTGTGLDAAQLVAAVTRAGYPASVL